jgi:hypothetical protein
MKPIKSIASITITITLAVYLLVVNCGISFSHIWCSQGSRWVLGTEMPDCKRATEKSICPYTQKECAAKKNSNNSSDSKEQRNKKSFHLNFKFIAEVSNPLFLKATTYFKLSLFNIACFTETISAFRLKPFFSSRCSNKAHPPPQLNKQLLSEIQVYRI